MSCSRYALIAVAVVLLVPRALVAQDGPATLEDLLNAVRADSQQRSQQNQEREQRFVQARDQQRALLQQAQRSLREEETRSDQLKATFDENERSLGELSETLQVRVGNMGELFGVVRQVAGDAKGIIDNSMISAQIADRAELANELAQAKGLPSIEDLTNLYGLLLEEMIESGKVVRFRTDIFDAEGKGATADVVRVGVFNAVTEDRFLNYKPETGTLQELARQPAGRFRSLAGGLADAESGTLPMAVDPSRGTILGLLIQAPSLVERIQQGGLVGYVIILLGLLGVLVALERLLYLLAAGGKIKNQLKADSPNKNNALGRILSVYDQNRDVDTETLELKLDEAIMREAPQLERRQSWIKVFAAVAPLLGLLGTVVGMIATFQAITLFGTGDPKLMAGGISQALITTVLGLIVAIPLVLLHSVVSGRSKSLVEILEEQSAGIIARHSEGETAV